MEKNYEALLFKTLCKMIRYNQDIGFKNDPYMQEISCQFAKVTGEDKWYFMSSLYQEDCTKQFYAIAYKLERTGLVRIVKGSYKYKKKTRMSLTDKGWDYIRMLRAKS